MALPAASAADIEDALSVVQDQGEDLGPERPTDKNEAKRLALAIGTRLPAVYGGPLTGAVAYRWKTDLEENAKVLAIAGAVPEMNHNEIEVWSGPGAAGRHAVLLREDGEPPEIAQPLHACCGRCSGPDAGGVSEVWARGRGRLARLLVARRARAVGELLRRHAAGNRSVAGADAHRGEAPAWRRRRASNARALESARNTVLE